MRRLKNMNTKFLFLTILSCVLSASLSNVQAASSKKSMVYGETGRLDRFDPYTAHEASGHRLSDLIFDSLVEPAEGGSYRSALAQSWDIRKAGTEVTVTLRDNVRWHRSGGASGASYKLSADDVVTTMRLLKAEKSEIPNKERFSVISDVKKVANNKVVFTFNRANIDPMRHLLFKVLPHHIVGNYDHLGRDSKFVTNPIGTGPYRYVKHNKTGEILLNVNDEYYAGRPKIKSIIMKNYADQNIMAQSLMYGALDLVTYVSPRSLDEISGDQRMGVVPYDALSYSFIAFNQKSELLKKKEVRQALSHAVNRKEMVDAFFYGKGKLISGPYAPTSWAYNMRVKGLEFSVERAKKLLDSQGVVDTNGDGVREFEGKPAKLRFIVPMAGESETLKRIVLAYQGYMADIGVQVDLKFVDWMVWKGKVLKERDYDLTIASWSFDDAANILSLFHSSSIKEWGNNFVGFSNQQVDSLLAEAASTANFDKRRSISHKLHQIIADEAPYTFLWTLEHHAAHNRQLSGVRVEPFSFFRHVAKWNKE